MDVRMSKRCKKGDGGNFEKKKFIGQAIREALKRTSKAFSVVGKAIWGGIGTSGLPPSSDWRGIRTSGCSPSSGRRSGVASEHQGVLRRREGDLGWHRNIRAFSVVGKAIWEGKKKNNYPGPGPTQEIQ